MLYKFHIFASGFGHYAELGQGTLEQGNALVEALGQKYEDWESRGFPDEDGAHTVWEGCDIAAFPEDPAGLPLYLDEDGVWLS